MRANCKWLIAALTLVGICGGAFAEPKQGGGTAVGALSFDARKARADVSAFLISRTSKSGLVASFANTSPYFFSQATGKFHLRYYGKMGCLDDQAFTYDLALASIGFLLNGDSIRAERILDCMQTEFYLPKNGSQGLFNSYLVSNRVPLDDMQLGADGDRIHSGPTLWVAIAALNHSKIERNTRYLPFALDIVRWCRDRLTYYRFADGERGGISMGMGWGPDWSKIFATEHNVDYYAVLRMLHDIYTESPEEVRAIFLEKQITDEWLLDEMAHVGRWLREVPFDPETYCFRAGFAYGKIDPTRVVDGTSWGIGGLGPAALESLGIDPARLMESTEKYLRASYKLPDGRIIHGFDLTDPEGFGHHRKRLVWFEATGQMIIAYQELAKYYQMKKQAAKAEQFGAKARRYLEDMRAFQEAYQLDGCLPYMSINPGEKQIVKTMKEEWEVARARSKDVWVGSMSSSMWYLYSLHGYYNPMEWSFD